ncbi:MAG: hypothetical protein WDO70_07600 [Alphaproteobacteria bacterium]
MAVDVTYLRPKLLRPPQQLEKRIGASGDFYPDFHRVALGYRNFGNGLRAFIGRTRLNVLGFRLAHPSLHGGNTCLPGIYHDFIKKNQAIIDYANT